MKFRIKIMICMLCLVSILFGVGSSALILISFQNGLEQERDTAENSYRLLIYTVQMSGEGETEMLSESENIQDTLRQIAGQRGSYWDSVVLSGGEGVLYSQGRAAEYLTRAEERGNAESCVVASFWTDDGSAYIRVSGGFSSGDQTMYLEAGHDISSLYEKREYQQKIYRIIFVTAMIICAVFSYGMAYLLTRPLSVLAKGAREISGGKLLIPDKYSFRR